MICDHAHGICWLPFSDNLTPEEFFERLLHWLGDKW